MRQLLTESMLLGLLGAAMGVLLAYWCKDALVAIIPRDVPRVGEIGIDGRVLAFALLVALVTGVLFGLGPALHATRLQLTASLKEGRFTTAFSGRHRLRRLLVVSEVAIALVLLVGAGLLMRSFLRVTDVDLGFRPERVMTFRMSPPDTGYAKGEQRAELFRQVIERVEALPGVQSVSASTTLPLTDMGIGLSFSVVGREQTVESEDSIALFDSVSPGYFEAMGIPLLSGRGFTERDRREGLGVMLINQAMEHMVRRLHPDVDPMGLRLKISADFDENEPDFFEIVGIVGDVRRSITDESEPHMYVPFQQQTWESMSFAVRTAGDPSSVVGSIRSEVSAVTKDVAAYTFRTLEEYLGSSVAHRVFAMTLLGIFAVLAVTLAAIGIYGTLSYSVAERVHEIGVRMAVGAVRNDVLLFVLRRGLTLTAIGLGIGMAAALVATRVLGSFLYETSTADPLTLIGVSVLLAVVAFLSCYIPARRATKVDPMVALRYE